jgi:hypothetical protein
VDDTLFKNIPPSIFYLNRTTGTGNIFLDSGGTVTFAKTLLYPKLVSSSQTERIHRLFPLYFQVNHLTKDVKVTSEIQRIPARLSPGPFGFYNFLPVNFMHPKKKHERKCPFLYACAGSKCILFSSPSTQPIDLVTVFLSTQPIGVVTGASDLEVSILRPFSNQQTTVFFISLCTLTDLPHYKNPRAYARGKSFYFYTFSHSHTKRVIHMSGDSCT